MQTTVFQTGEDFYASKEQKQQALKYVHSELVKIRPFIFDDNLVIKIASKFYKNKGLKKY